MSDGLHALCIAILVYLCINFVAHYFSVSIIALCVVCVCVMIVGGGLLQGHYANMMA